MFEESLDGLARRFHALYADYLGPPRVEFSGMDPPLLLPAAYLQLAAVFDGEGNGRRFAAVGCCLEDAELSSWAGIVELRQYLYLDFARGGEFPEFFESFFPFAQCCDQSTVGVFTGPGVPEHLREAVFSHQAEYGEIARVAESIEHYYSAMLQLGIRRGKLGKFGPHESLTAEDIGFLESRPGIYHPALQGRAPTVGIDELPLRAPQPAFT